MRDRPVNAVFYGSSSGGAFSKRLLRPQSADNWHLGAMKNRRQNCRAFNVCNGYFDFLALDHENGAGDEITGKVRIRRCRFREALPRCARLRPRAWMPFSPSLDRLPTCRRRVCHRFVPFLDASHILDAPTNGLQKTSVLNARIKGVVA
jgi:hypothetical protein